MTDEATPRTCVICQKRQYERLQVCEPCRTRLPNTITAIVNLWAQLITPPDAADRTAWTVQQRRPQPTTDPDRKRPWTWAEETGYDPVAATLPAGLAGSGHGPKVTGSREAPVPVNLDVVDLTAPARNASPTPAAKEFPEDQTGHAAVASVLDDWVRDWRRLRDEQLRSEA